MPRTSVRKPVGISIHIGLNRVDPKQYEGWDGQLAGCEFDARDMQKIATSKGFRSTLLLTRKATTQAVIGALEKAAQTLKRGDILFLTYSGHGGQVPDRNGDEGDQKDETWVLFDRMLIDDELYGLWAKFEQGVRVIVLSDSCHSGTVLKERQREERRTHLLSSGDVKGARANFKYMPRTVQSRTYLKHKTMYDKLQAIHPKGDRLTVGARVVLISGCADAQTSADGDRNGLFTETVKEVWDGGKYRGGYRAFQKAIAELMPDDQQPNYFTVGTANPQFEHQRPFTI